MLGWAILVGLVAGVGLTLLWRERRKKRKELLAVTEYWVYLPQPQMPKQEDLMTYMVAENPHTKPGKPPIGAREGLLFTDVRLHLGLAIRDKNPNVFRPDLFHEITDPTSELLEGLAQSKALVKVRYLSEEPLKDYRHLQFLPHMADAVAQLAKGTVIFDNVSELLFTAGEFHQLLSETTNIETFDFHCRIAWFEDQEGGWAESRGLPKIGVRDLKTPVSPHDQRVLITLIMEDVCRKLFESGETPERMTTEAFGDSFEILFGEAGQDDKTEVRILRTISSPS